MREMRRNLRFVFLAASFSVFCVSARAQDDPGRERRRQQQSDPDQHLKGADAGDGGALKQAINFHFCVSEPRILTI